MSDYAMKRGNSRGQTVLCPKCHREHHSDTSPMDEFVDCGCGFSFYAFAERGLCVLLTPEEASYEPIARSLRKFIVSTGRCTDISPALYQDAPGETFIREPDLDVELERILEDFQMAAFGECFFTKDLIYSMCETLQDGNDFELRKQKDRIDLIKLIRKKVNVQEKRPAARQRITAYGMMLGGRRDLTQIPGKAPRQGGIMTMSQNLDKTPATQ